MKATRRKRAQDGAKRTTATKRAAGTKGAAATKRAIGAKRASTKRPTTAAPASRHPRRSALPGSMRQLERVRAICLELPDATEKEAWGSPTFRVKDRMFAMFANDHHGDGRVALWLKAPPGAQPALVESEPERFFVPPYVGPSGWIGLDLKRLNDAEVAYFAKVAWESASARRSGGARRRGTATASPKRR